MIFFLSINIKKLKFINLPPIQSYSSATRNKKVGIKKDDFRNDGKIKFSILSRIKNRNLYGDTMTNSQSKPDNSSKKCFEGKKEKKIKNTHHHQKKASTETSSTLFTPMIDCPTLHPLSSSLSVTHNAAESGGDSVNNKLPSPSSSPLMLITPEKSLKSSSNHIIDQHQGVPTMINTHYADSVSRQRQHKKRIFLSALKRLFQPYKTFYELEWNIPNYKSSATLSTEKIWLQLDKQTSGGIERVRRLGFADLDVRLDDKLTKYINNNSMFLNNSKKLESILIEILFSSGNYHTATRKDSVLQISSSSNEMIDVYLLRLRRVHWWTKDYNLARATCLPY